MQTFDTIPAARMAIMDFYGAFFATVPDNAKGQFRQLSVSPVPPEQIVGLGEFIYANRESMEPEALSLAAGLIAFATVNAWYGLLDDDRGNRIVANLRKALGEITKAPAAPEPLRQYVIAETFDEPLPITPPSDA